MSTLLAKLDFNSYRLRQDPQVLESSWLQLLCSRDLPRFAQIVSDVHRNHRAALGEDAKTDFHCLFLELHCYLQRSGFDETSFDLYKLEARLAELEKVWSAAVENGVISKKAKEIQARYDQLPDTLKRHELKSHYCLSLLNLHLEKDLVASFLNQPPHLKAIGFNEERLQLLSFQCSKKPSLFFLKEPERFNAQLKELEQIWNTLLEGKDIPKRVFRWALMIEKAYDQLVDSEKQACIKSVFCFSWLASKAEKSWATEARWFSLFNTLSPHLSSDRINPSFDLIAYKRELRKVWQQFLVDPAISRFAVQIQNACDPLPEYMKLDYCFSRLKEEMERYYSITLYPGKYPTTRLGWEKLKEQIAHLEEQAQKLEKVAKTLSPTGPLDKLELNPYFFKPQDLLQLGSRWQELRSNSQWPQLSRIIADIEREAPQAAPCRLFWGLRRYLSANGFKETSFDLIQLEGRLAELDAIWNRAQSSCAMPRVSAFAQEIEAQYDGLSDSEKRLHLRSHFCLSRLIKRVESYYHLALFPDGTYPTTLKEWEKVEKRIGSLEREVEKLDTEWNRLLDAGADTVASRFASSIPHAGNPIPCFTELAHRMDKYYGTYYSRSYQAPRYITSFGEWKRLEQEFSRVEEGMEELKVDWESLLAGNSFPCLTGLVHEVEQKYNLLSEEVKQSNPKQTRCFIDLGKALFCPQSQWGYSLQMQSASSWNRVKEAIERWSKLQQSWEALLTMEGVPVLSALAHETQESKPVLEESRKRGPPLHAVAYFQGLAERIRAFSEEASLRVPTRIWDQRIITYNDWEEIDENVSSYFFPLPVEILGILASYLKEEHKWNTRDSIITALACFARNLQILQRTNYPTWEDANRAIAQSYPS
ncbi:MAG: hypothetical protein JSS61_06775 [Verrucomicrobia bacterium]|nr:hypothetical protein [Verrucomicrobiota bacterium]